MDVLEQFLFTPAVWGLKPYWCSTNQAHAVISAKLLGHVKH